MEEIIQVNDQFYVLATSPRVDNHARVLKQGDTFAVFDSVGDIEPLGLGEQGIFHEGTRFLSRFKVLLDGRRPLLLSSTVVEDNTLLTVDLTNADVKVGNDIVLARDTIHLFRCSFLWQGQCHTKLRVRNYALQPVAVSLALVFDADFVDIFEVRGTRRPRRGQVLPPSTDGDRVALGYRGLDGVVRRTDVCFSPRPDRLSSSTATFDFQLAAQDEQTVLVTVACSGDHRPAIADFHDAFEHVKQSLSPARLGDARVSTANERFNDWINRSAADLRMMLTQTGKGPYPYAGVPWFSTVFGRDGIITALEYLWVNPEVARGVLAYLAANQSAEVNPAQDAEPGKILHETRRGEMAALGEIPFGKYYGTVDATPLFVVLAGAYYQRTADREFAGALWPHVERALQWIDDYGDADGDGFVEYARHSANGLTVQGWKDSFDSVFHADGALAEGPVALVEVQGYVYAARQAAAELAQMMGNYPRAGELFDQADRLKERFERAFWCDEISTYALALDGRKRPCRVRTSNPGHCLFSGIVPRERAALVTRTLLDEQSFSGWGIRTVAACEARYNPMSYHNGSVWPHDNALIAAGMARYGLIDEALRVLSGLFDASLFVDLQRMPELFCGFGRRAGEGPTLYPVACAPQSWAAGSVFMLLAACLGLSIDAPRRQVRFHRPRLPETLEEMSIQGLRVAGATVDLHLTRHPHDVGITVTRRDGELDVVVVQ